MNSKDILILLSKIIVVATIPIILISTNIIILFNPFYVRMVYSGENFPRSENLTCEDMNEYNDLILSYIENTTDISTLENFNVLSENEISHLNDVRTLFEKIQIIQKVSIFVSVYLILFVVLTSKNKYGIISFVLTGIILTSILALISLILLKIDFNYIFINLHKVLFPEGNWSFNRNSLLIQLYPETFWVFFGSLFLLLILIESLTLFFVISTIMRRLKKRKN